MSPKPEEPRREKQEWEKKSEEVQAKSFLDLKGKVRKNTLKPEEEGELNRRKDRIYNIFFGNQGFLKERENFRNRNLPTDYDAALEGLSRNLQDFFLKVPGLTWKDLKERIFGNDAEVIQIQKMGEEISQNEEKVKAELMDYLERKINEILEEKRRESGARAEVRPIEMDKNYLVDSVESLRKKLKEAKGEELKKLQEAIRRHNDEVRKRAEKRKSQVFHYRLLPKQGETDEDRTRFNQGEFQRFLGYYKGLSPQELEKRGWTKSSTEGEGFLKFVKEKWDTMWERAVKDVENKFSKKTQSPQETEPQKSGETGEKGPQESAPVQEVKNSSQGQGENHPQGQGENHPQGQGENLSQGQRNEWVGFGPIKIKKELISKGTTAALTGAIGGAGVLSLLIMFGIPSLLALLGGFVVSSWLGWRYNEKIQNFFQK